MERLVGELEKIEPVEGGASSVDEYGMRWEEHIRHIRLVGYRQGNQIVRELPKNLEGKVIKQQRKLCIEPGYEWHFKTKHIDRPVLITFSEEETKKIESEA